MNNDLHKILKEYDKILVLGFPKVGKTKICNEISDREIIHTDDFIGEVPWEHQPEYIITQIHNKDKYIIEGVQCFRVLRTGLLDHTYKPDVVLYLRSSCPPLRRHIAMRKTLQKIWEGFTELNRGRIPVIHIKSLG